MKWFKLFRPYRAVNTPSQSQNPSANSVYGLLRSVKFKGTSLAESYMLWDKIKIPFDEISWQNIRHCTVNISLHGIAWVCTFAAVWTSILGTFRKLHICHYTHIDRNTCQFAGALSISKALTLAEQSTISAVSRYLYQCYPEIILPPHDTHALNSVSDWLRSDSNWFLFIWSALCLQGCI